jgi:hypothetical protein
MTQRDRDRLVVLKKAQKKLIQQKQAAQELGITPRQVRRLLRGLKEKGDKAVLHGLRGRPSKRKIGAADRDKIVRILSQEVYRGFGPTLASEYLRDKHAVKIGREALRQIMRAAGLWRAQQQKVETVHQWRQRRSCRGELVQWDTSTHDWLEGRGGQLYLIHMIDDATSEWTARFVPHDSTEENMRLLRTYLERHGRPVAFYTDKASQFHTTPKVARDVQQLPRDEREPLPPTQIGRALRELGIVWIAAHSPQAKGRVERSFGTAQDRLVKGLRVAKVKTLQDANRYLDEQFVPWWNQHLTVAPAQAADAHRPLGPEHDLAATLSRVETRQVGSDYTFSVDGQQHQIERESIMTGLRGATVRLERRLDGSLAARFRERYLALSSCGERPAEPPGPQLAPHRTEKRAQRAKPSENWRAALDRLFRPGPSVRAVARIDRTRTAQRLD